MKNLSLNMAVKYGLLLIIIAVILASCASSKSKHSEYQKTDSTHKEQEQTITKVKVDSAATHEKTSEEENSVVIDFGDSQMVVVPQSGKDSGIYFNPNNTNANDYFYWDGTTLISSKVPKKVTIKGSIKKSEKDSAVKSMEALQDHSRIVEDNVTKVEKKVTKQKECFNLLWLLWLLLIPVGYWVWKNKSKFLAFYPF
jgi:PBP1b-binding outer membrane lipoprotein LpoB